MWHVLHFDCLWGGSIYYVCVHNDGIVGVTGKKPEGRKRLGFIKIDVADIVENRRITDTWSLMDSQQGEIQLKLEWMPLQLAEVM